MAEGTADRRITYLLQVLTDPKAKDAFEAIAKMSEGLDKRLSFTAKAGGQSTAGFGGGAAAQDAKVAEATNGHLAKRNGLLETNGKHLEAVAGLAAKVATSTKEAAAAEAEFAKNALAGLHAKADVLAAALREKARPKEEAEAAKEADAQKRALDKKVAAAEKAEAALFKTKTENLKALQAWEDKQTKFEEDAALKRGRAGKKSAEQAVSDAEHAAALTKEANQKVIDSFGQGVDGALKLGRAFAMAGLIGQEDFGKVRDTILGVQTAIDTLKGGMDVWRSFSGLSGLAKGGGLAGAAGGAGEIASLAGAIAPAVSALGPFALGVAGATAAVLALKHAADVVDKAFVDKARAAGRALADKRYGVIGDTQVGDSETERDRAMRESGGGHSGGLTRSIVNQGRGGSLLDNNFLALMTLGNSKLARHALGGATEEGGREGNISKEAELEREKQILEDRKRGEVEISDRRVAEVERRQAERDKARGIDQLKDRLFANPNATTDDKILKSAADRLEIEKQIAVVQKDMDQESARGTEETKGAAVLKLMEEQDGLRRQSLELLAQEEALSRQAQTEKIDGLKSQLTLQEQIADKERQTAAAALKSIQDQIAAVKQGAKSDKQKFGELNPFEQKETATLIKRAQGGENLSDKELRRLKELGFHETAGLVDKETEARGGRAAAGHGLEFGTKEEAALRDQEKMAGAEFDDVNARARTGRQEILQKIEIAGGKISLDLGGQMKIEIAYSDKMAKQLDAQLAKYKEEILKTANEAAIQEVRRALQRQGQTRNAK